MNTGVLRFKEQGFSLIELIIAVTMIVVVGVAATQLYVTLINTVAFMQKRSIALDMSANQMEYLRSLPYDNLQVGTNETTEVKNGYPYTIKTIVRYVDDYGEPRGCLNYGSDEGMQANCRGWTKATDDPNKRRDDNPMDYKAATIEIRGRGSILLSSASSYFGARVAETASGTGAIVVKIIDGGGNPVEGATVTCENPTTTPRVVVADCTETTTADGYAIFYGLPPDTRPDYVLTAWKDGYSKIWTIPSSGNLQPVYPNVSLLPQTQSLVTLRIFPKSTSGILIETVDTFGNHLPNIQVAIRGGYKKYTNPNNNDYYYQYGRVDARPITDANGFVGVNVVSDDDASSQGSGLAPGEYFFCDDYSNNACRGSSGAGSSHVLIAALPYEGSTPFSPVMIPSYIAGVSPEPKYTYNGVSYIQKVRLVLASNAALPTVTFMSGASIKLSGMSPQQLAAVPFTLRGEKLGSLGPVNFIQELPSGEQTTFPASCAGTNNEVNCTANLTGVQIGIAHLEFGSGSKTLKYISPPDGEYQPLGGFIIGE